MIYPILSSKVFVFSIWTQQTFACSNSTIRTKLEICSQLTINTLEWRHWHRSSVLILNFEQFSPLVLVLQLLTLNRQFLAGPLISQTRPPKIKSLVPLNFAISKICVAKCLAEDERRMGSIYSFNYPLVQMLERTYYPHIFIPWGQKVSK